MGINRQISLDEIYAGDLVPSIFSVKATITWWTDQARTARYSCFKEEYYVADHGPPGKQSKIEQNGIQRLVLKSLILDTPQEAYGYLSILFGPTHPPRARFAWA